jgi:hypothetical protein
MHHQETAGRSSELPDLERTVLRATREITSGLRVDNATFEALRNHFDHEHIVELMLIISFYNGVVRFLESLAIDVEPEYKPPIVKRVYRQVRAPLRDWIEAATQNSVDAYLSDSCPRVN